MSTVRAIPEPEAPLMPRQPSKTKDAKPAGRSSAGAGGSRAGVAEQAKPATKASTKAAGTKTATKTAVRTTAADNGGGRRSNQRVTPIPGRQPASVPEELQRLWTVFKKTASQDARERLILHYAPLVKYVASRVATGLPASVEQADLVSYGMFGVIDALEKFELDRGIKFETYAIPRIRGAIIDELRSLDWVPRSVRFKHREFEKAYAEVEARLKRAPTDREIAEHLGISLPELHDIVTQISSVSILALDEPVSVGADRGETISLMDTLSDVAHGDLMEGLEGDEMRAMLSAAINSLSDREKIVVTLYYFEGLTLSEIGDVLGVTESRVCQIHTKAVGQLRIRLADSGDD
jgi:RNA polymerase sigma factor for flagellar operon FliA